MKIIITDIIILFFIVPAVLSFHEENHLPISDRAVKSSTAIEGALTDLNLDYSSEIRNKEIIEIIKLGSKEEDGWRGWPLIEFNPDADPSEDIRRSNNHFYDPQHDKALDDPCILAPPIPPGTKAYLWALLGSPEMDNIYSLEQAKQYYYDALTISYPDQRKELLTKFYLSIGHFIHMIQDMAVPAHVRNDNHGINMLGMIEDQVPLLEVEPFEIYCDEAANRVSYEPNAVYNFEHYRDYWTTANGEGLSDFTSNYFVSVDTNLDYDSSTCRYLIDFPHPSADYQTYWEMEGYEVKFDGNNVEDTYLGETYQNHFLTARSYWSGFTEFYGSVFYSLNAICLGKAAEFLVPRATAYSVGLLDHFFEPRIDTAVAYDHLHDSWLTKITNISDLDFGSGHIRAFWFRHSNSANMESHWIDQNGFAVSFNGSYSLYINGLDSGQNLEIPNTRFNLPSDYDEPTIDVLVLFNGVVNGESNRTVAKVINLDLTYVDVNFTKVLFEDFNFANDCETSYKGYHDCMPNNYGGCSNVYYYTGDICAGYRHGYKQSIYATIPSSSGENVDSIVIQPEDLIEESDYELMVNGIPVGRTWLKVDHPDMVPETLMIKVNYDPTNNDNPYPLMVINSRQTIYLPFVKVEHHWKLFDKVVGILGEDHDCLFRIYGPPNNQAEFKVYGPGLVIANGKDADNRVVSLYTRVDYGSQETICRNGLDYDFMETLVLGPYSAMAAWYNSYVAEYSEMRPDGEMERVYSEEERELAESCGRYLREYTFPLRSLGQ